MLLSSHHLRLSELAGGKPGSMDSYPFKSSSSVSSTFPLAVKVPTDDLRCRYNSALNSSLCFSSTKLTLHKKVAYTGR